MTIPEKAFNGLRHNPNIAAIELDPVRELVRSMPSVQKAESDTTLEGQIVPYGVDMVQARQIWDADLDGEIDWNAPTGEGRTVCIIDTGFYTGHEEFQGVDILGGFAQTKLTPDDGDWDYDGYGHGTHVAGTIVAMDNGVGFVGVSPGKVSLFIVKIFGDDGLWVSKAHASDLIEAAFLCADNGANVISMSLSGTNRSGKEEQAFDQLYAAGVLSVGAVSNDGIEEYHYPASYDSVISWQHLMRTSWWPISPSSMTRLNWQHLVWVSSARCRGYPMFQ